ncbi:MAG TPA: RHS repeat-associated core domain-containing protein, partial [Cyclobacteriaceae bacterium]|nr:RHS repeat-associated core domain-containing protein [Cyclobacteriaceae bacterium]
MFARYSTGTGSNNALISNLASVVTGSFGLTSGEAAHTALTNNVPPQAATIGQTTGIPKAYLFYILFNSSYAYQQFGYIAVNSTALVGHQQMYLDITIPTGGYLYTYVANEANVSSATSVYFDDFTIVHTRNTPTLQVLQTNDYYPFGLQIAASSYQKQTALDNDYLYNGKELQDEHNLGWSDYGARMYMSDLGRWGVADPLTEEMRRWSAYNYAFDNPISFIDPDGKKPMPEYCSMCNGNENSLRWQFYTEARIREAIDPGMAICRNCPNTPVYQPYIDDPNNVYFYDSESGLVTLIQLLAPVVVQANSTTMTAPLPTLPPIRIPIPKVVITLGAGATFTLTAFLVALPVAGAGEGEAQILEDINAERNKKLKEFLLSRGGEKNIWPDQYGYPPDVKKVDWAKGDDQLATETAQG